MAQLNIRLDDALVRAVKVRAAELGESLTRVVERGLRMYLGGVGSPAVVPIPGVDQALDAARAPRRVEPPRAAPDDVRRADLDVRLCGCGHGLVSHRPTCLTRGCGCKAYRAA